MTFTGASLSCLRTKPTAFLALSQFFALEAHTMACPASHRPDIAVRKGSERALRAPDR